MRWSAKNVTDLKENRNVKIWKMSDPYTDDLIAMDRHTAKLVRSMNGKKPYILKWEKEKQYQVTTSIVRYATNRMVSSIAE